MSYFPTLHQPSLLKGVARSVDLFAQVDTTSYLNQSDSQFIQQDWTEVGQDLSQSLQTYVETTDA